MLDLINNLVCSVPACAGALPDKLRTRPVGRAASMALKGGDSMALALAIPKSALKWSEVSPAAHEAACDAAVRALKSAASKWPADTGRSKRAWRVVGSGYGAVIYNPLDYSEFYRDAGERTLAAAVGRIRAAAKKAADIASPLRPKTAVQRRNEALAEVLRAAAKRESDAKALAVYDMFRENQKRQRGIRNPKMIAALSVMRRRIRRMAAGLPDDRQIEFRYRFREAFDRGE